MAAREGQGLQIAVILFAMLTIILAITTYIFYAQSQTAEKERADAVAARAQLQITNNKLLYRVLALKLTIGLGGVTQDQVDAAKTTAGGEDTEVTELLTAYNQDMAAFGDQAADVGVRNWRTLPAFLIGEIQKKNAAVVQSNDNASATQVAKADSEKKEKARADTAESARDVAQNDLKKEKDNYAAEQTRIAKEKEAIAAQLGDKDKKFKTDIDRVTKERDQLIAINTQQTQTVTSIKTRLDELEKGQTDLFENPDGKVTWVNQRQRLVWINVGRADGLLRQTTFSVFDHDINGVSNEKPKGRIEVIRLSDEHIAECRILEDDAANPILPNDVIHTPSWSPGQRIHFAMAGVMDIDKDGINDYDLVRNIITLNGGVIDAELKEDGTRVGNITVNTRYMVLGDRPTERTTNDKVLKEFTNIQGEVQRFGTDIIPVQKLLQQMGWRAEERTVELAGAKGGGEFRTRKPGQKPAAGGPAAGGAVPPVAVPPPAGGGVDPFAAPAAPAGGGAVDPFAAPAPAAPMPAPAAVDPFATP
ncbi:MAG: hypothetical protein SFU86_09400 [Pirellulaceae bacterium]|nr:hypothetical protein [Pirellulaceae bacterium]